MSIKEGEKVNDDGETVGVSKIYSDRALRKSSALLQSIDGVKRRLIRTSSIRGQETDFWS